MILNTVLYSCEEFSVQASVMLAVPESRLQVRRSPLSEALAMVSSSRCSLTASEKVGAACVPFLDVSRIGGILYDWSAD